VLRPKDGTTPAIVAARRGDVDILALLWDAGADLNKAANVRLSSLSNPLDFIISKLYSSFLLAFICPSNLLSTWLTIIFQPFFFSSGALMRLFCIKDGTTPATIAAAVGHVEILELLRDAGADLNKAKEVLFFVVVS